MAEPYTPGYYRDSDSIMYVTSKGDVYLVTEPGNEEPVWRKVGPPLSEDTEPTTPGAEDFALFERCRVAYQIAA
jgi:hypothetical protein